LLSSVSAALLLLAVFTAPNTDLADCGNLADRYNAAVAKVVEALRHYEKCIATSNERSDCEAEMQALDNAHDDFTDAVDDAKDCR